MANNDREPNTKKRGRPSNKLAVRLFLLDPDHLITKVTKETCSKKAIEQLMRNGYGPPRPEHCTKDERGHSTLKVEFSFELTNEAFKQKLIQVYPKLENACFVFMKADKINKLVELNPGGSCFRCYTPESIFYSDRGQGRLYIRKIAEAEISPCNHGISIFKRLRSMVGGNQPFYLPIAPKPAASTMTSTGMISTFIAPPGKLSNLSNVSILAESQSKPTVQKCSDMPIQRALPSTSVLPVTLQGSSSTSAIFSDKTTTTHSSGKMVRHSQSSLSSVPTQIPSTPAIYSFSKMVPQIQQPLLAVVSQSPATPAVYGPGKTVAQSEPPVSAVVSHSLSKPSLPGSGNLLVQNPLPLSAVVTQTPLTPATGKIEVHIQSPILAAVSQTSSTRSIENTGNIAVAQSQSPLLAIVSQTPSISNMLVQSQSPSSAVVLQTSSTTSIPKSGDTPAQDQSPFSPVVSHLPRTPAINSSGNIVRHGQSSLSAVVSQTPLTPAIQNFGNVLRQSQTPSLPVASLIPPTESQHESDKMVPQSQSPLSAVVSKGFSSEAVHSFDNIARKTQLQTPSPVIVSYYTLSQVQNQLPATRSDLSRPVYSDSISTNDQQSSAIVSQIALSPCGTSDNSSIPLHNSSNVVFLARQGQSQAFVSGSATHHQEWQPREVYQPDVSFKQPSLIAPAPNQVITVPTVNTRSERWVPFPGLDVLANVAQRERAADSITSSSCVQANVDLLQREELHVDTLYENVKTTSTLKISLAVLHSDALMKRLKESTINIHTIEIESTCKLHQVLSRYSLPSRLKVLRINDNNLDFEDISDLVRCLSCVNGLYELDLRRTKFVECSLYAFICVLRRCNSLLSLSLTDNGLTKDEVTSLITAFESIGSIKKLNLSKCIITETQASDILQKLEQAKNIAFLNLSQNRLQGSEIIAWICQLQSLEEVDLSHNYLRFFPLPDFEGKHDCLSVSIKSISLSSNHMTPCDISQFCSLISSDLLNLKLDCNHVGNAIWSLCSMPRRIKHLKVLGLANADICGLAVDGLAVLLSLVRELEELNLSSNNLVSADFQQLQSPLSNLFRLKRLNLSDNREGVSALLETILPSLEDLEELILSNTHLNGEDLRRICHPVASLRGLKYLELSTNAIGSSGIRELASVIKHFPLLERLDLSRACFQGDDIMVLCQGLVTLKMLKYLNLSGNMIDSEVLDDVWFLPPTLEELIFSDVIHGEKLFAKVKLLHNLRKLHLTNLKLRACDVKMLATALSSFLRLEELSLAAVVIADSTCDKIFNAIKSLGSLRKLHLAKLKLRPYDIEVLATKLSYFLGLEELSLADISIVDSNCDKIFSAIKSLGNLRKLHLTKLKLCASDIEVLANTLSSFLGLEELTLGNIITSDTNHDKTLTAIKSLANIRKIDLSGIRLYDESSLADMLSSLLSLEELVLTGMSVVNMDDGRFFGAIKLLKRLRKLDLGGINVCEENVFFDMLSSLLMLEEIVFPSFVSRNSCSSSGYFNALKSLRYLRNLDLHCSKICKSDEEGLARGLASLQLLERLALGIITCDNQKQLFIALGNLRYLKELEFIKTSISKNGAEAFVRILPSLQMLKKLVLEEIHFDHERDGQLFLALGNLKYLEELHVVKLNMSKIDIECLGRVLPSLKLLEKLVLVENCCDECKEHVFSALGNLEYLKELYLFGTYITKICAEALFRVLPSLQLLEKLVYGEFYNISDGEQFAVLGKLQYLRELDFGKTDLTKVGAEALACVMPSMKVLEKLVLGKIDCDHECGLQLFAALGTLKYLKELHFVQMNITKPHAEALARVLPSLTLLEKLVLGVVTCADECDEQLFAALGNLKYLEELDLGDTCITKNVAEALVCVLPSLKSLDKLVFRDFDCEDECDEQLFAALRNIRYFKKRDS